MNATNDIPVGLEVSCRAVEPFLKIAREHGYSLERLAEGLQVTASDLSDNKRSMSWGDFRRIGQRVEGLVGGPKGMEAAGARFMDVPALRAFAKVIALFANVQKLYATSDEFSRTRLFRCLETDFEIVTSTQIRTIVTVPEPYEPSRAFFWFLAGVFRATPWVLGLPDSIVQVTIEGRACTYVIDHAPSNSLWGRIRRVFRILFSARHTLDELQAQNEQLMAQLAEVADARRTTEEAARTKSEFLANMSHELRTPLNAIVGAAGFLKDSELDSEQQEHLQMVEEGGQDLVDLVEQVLDFSRLDAGMVELELRPFDLWAVVRGVEERTRTDAEAKGVTSKLVVHPEVPRWVIGDQNRLAQVLTNLCDNAVKFTEAGGVALHVRPAGGDEGTALCFEVRDTGVGLPEETHQHIFDPFTQRDATLTRRQGGTGLGLTVVHQLLMLMGGRLEIDSTVGKGSTFGFVVKFRAASGPEAVNTLIEAPQPPRAKVATPRWKLPTPAPAPAPVALRNVRVLVAEDNLLNQKILVRMLQRLGCVVDVANDGSEAMQAVLRANYQIVFMDCQMPTMDGLEATRQIRDFEAPLGATPIVAVTAHAVEGHREQCLACGMDDYLSKPVDPALLRQVLQRYANDESDPNHASAK